MSLPAFDGLTWLFVAGSIGVAFLGSWHCAGMCGPIAALANRPRQFFFYQVGRLASYALLGTLAGAFGKGVLGWIPDDRKWIVSLVLGLFSLWILFAVWNLELPRQVQRFLWQHRPRHHEILNFFSLGALNGLLPCHWLYGFLVVAAGSGSPVKGAALTFSLWVGSLPWLLGASSLSGLARRFLPASPWMARLLLVVVVIGLILQGYMVGDPHLGCKLAEF